MPNASRAKVVTGKSAAPQGLRSQAAEGRAARTHGAARTVLLSGTRRCADTSRVAAHLCNVGSSHTRRCARTTYGARRRSMRFSQRPNGAAWAHVGHICTRTGLTPATSAPGLGTPLHHLLQDSAHSCHICNGTRLTPATSAPGLGSRLPHLHRDWAHPGHICTGTGLTPATSAPGLGSRRPQLQQDRAHPSQIRTGTRPTPATSAPGPGVAVQLD